MKWRNLRSNRPALIKHIPSIRKKVGEIWAKFRAIALHMGAKHFSELICWRLARDLRKEVFKLTSRKSFDQDFKFRNQLTDAGSSACSNIAEGFGRVTHRDFAHFLDFSRTSINEIENRLEEAVERDLLERSEIARALNLCKRARVAASRLMKSLKDRPDPARNRWPGR